MAVGWSDLWQNNAFRCMEEMGDWAKVLEVINSENAETCAEDGDDDMAEPSDERLFLKEDGWDGPKFLRFVFMPPASHKCSIRKTSLNF